MDRADEMTTAWPCTWVSRWWYFPVIYISPRQHLGKKGFCGPNLPRIWWLRVWVAVPMPLACSVLSWKTRRHFRSPQLVRGKTTSMQVKAESFTEPLSFHHHKTDLWWEETILQMQDFFFGFPKNVQYLYMFRHLEDAYTNISLFSVDKSMPVGTFDLLADRKLKTSDLNKSCKAYESRHKFEPLLKTATSPRDAAGCFFVGQVRIIGVEAGGEHGPWLPVSWAKSPMGGNIMSSFEEFLWWENDLREMVPVHTSEFVWRFFWGVNGQYLLISHRISIVWRCFWGWYSGYMSTQLLKDMLHGIPKVPTVHELQASWTCWKPSPIALVNRQVQKHHQRKTYEYFPKQSLYTKYISDMVMISDIMFKTTPRYMIGRASRLKTILRMELRLTSTLLPWLRVQ